MSPAKKDEKPGAVDQVKNKVQVVLKTDNQKKKGVEEGALPTELAVKLARKEKLRGLTQKPGISSGDEFVTSTKTDTMKKPAVPPLQDSSQ